MAKPLLTQKLQIEISLAWDGLQMKGTAYEQREQTITTAFQGIFLFEK